MTPYNQVVLCKWWKSRFKPGWLGTRGCTPGRGADLTFPQAPPPWQCTSPEAGRQLNRSQVLSFTDQRLQSSNHRHTNKYFNRERSICLAESRWWKVQRWLWREILEGWAVLHVKRVRSSGPPGRQDSMREDGVSGEGMPWSGNFKSYIVTSASCVAGAGEMALNIRLRVKVFVSSLKVISDLGKWLEHVFILEGLERGNRKQEDQLGSCLNCPGEKGETPKLGQWRRDAWQVVAWMGIVNRVKLQSKFPLRPSGEGAPLGINGLFRAFSTSSELESALVPLAEHQRKTVGLQNPYGTRCLHS